MTERQENKFSMYRTAEQVLDTNSAIWLSNAGFAAAKSSFSSRITDIFSVSQQHGAVITGIATDKKVLKRTMIDVTTPVSAGTIVLATQTNNNQLLDEVNFSESELINTRDDEIAQRCQTIHDRANDNIAALTTMGITAAMLTAQQTAIDAYKAKVPTPGAAKAAKKALSLQLRTLFKSTDNLLKLELDNLMKQYKVSHPEFYNAYKAARVIHDLGATHTRMRATIKDENSQQLANASVSLLQGNMVVYQVVSDAAGKVALSKIKPGTYTLKVHKTNFNTFTEEGIQFKAGREVKRTVALSSASAPPAYISISKEGNVAGNTVENIDTSDVNPTPNSLATIEVTEGTITFYAAPTPVAMPGAVSYEQSVGSVTMTMVAFANALGFDPTNKLLNAYNAAGTNAHYKITFTNLEP